MDFSEKTPFPKDPRFRTREIKNLLMPLFLMGCFPVDFQEAKRPLRTTSVKRPIKVGKRPINEGKRPIKAKVLVGISVGCLMGCFRATPPWRKTAPLKRPIKRSMRCDRSFCRFDFPKKHSAALTDSLQHLDCEHLRIQVWKGRNTQYCFESTVSEKRTHWVLWQTRWVSPWRTNHRLRGTHWALSPELGEGQEAAN